MRSWYELAEQQICEDHDNGLMSDKEYRQAMRELCQEYDEAARQDAEDTYNSWY